MLKTRSEAVHQILIINYKLLKQRVYLANRRTVRVFQGQTVSNLKKKKREVWFYCRIFNIIIMEKCPTKMVTEIKLSICQWFIQSTVGAYDRTRLFEVVILQELKS